MSINFGGSSKKEKGSTKVELPEASPAEKELSALNLELAKMQLQEMQQAQADQAAYDASPLAATQKAIEEKASANILARLTGQAPVLSPEEQARLDEVYGVTQKRGEEDLARFARDMASARGMTTADSPIGDTALQEHRKFTEGLGASKSAAALDLGQTNSLFDQGLREFQDRLRQQSYMNRLAMAQVQPAAYGLANSLFAQRLQSAPRHFRGYQSTFNWGAGLSGSDAGGMMQGLGAMGVGG